MKPDYVFHLAAHFANQNSVDNPETDLMVNGIGILKVLQYAQLTGVERFVYSSSGCGVYGLDSKMPFEEHDISISLHTPYQVTKLLGELYTNYLKNSTISWTFLTQCGMIETVKGNALGKEET